MTGDQCMYGLTASEPGGPEQPARKSTSFLTSSYLMADRLKTKCSGDHPHTALHGKQLEAAAFYPAKLRLAILRGMRDTADRDAPTEFDAEVERETKCAGINICGIQNKVNDNVKTQHKEASPPKAKAFFKFESGGRTETDGSRHMKER